MKPFCKGIWIFCMLWILPMAYCFRAMVVLYDANENTGVNFKTITLLNDDPGCVDSSNYRCTRTHAMDFFEGRINRKIINTGTKMNISIRWDSTTGGSGVVGDYFYCPSLVQFASNTNNNYLVGTYLNNNNNFVVDGIFIGNTGHGCGNPFEIDDQGGQTATTCLNHEIDMVGDFFGISRRITDRMWTVILLFSRAHLDRWDYSIECRRQI